jgi:hypothetical protein
MKRLTPRFKTPEDLKRWTFDYLRVCVLFLSARDDAAYVDAAMQLYVQRENDPLYVASVQADWRAHLKQRQILAALEAQDWRKLTSLTSDDKFRAFAWQENFRPSGRRVGEQRESQPFSSGQGREVRDHLLAVRGRIAALWHAYGIRGQKKLSLSPDQLAIEWVLGSKKEWQKQQPPQVTFSWQDRNDELERVLASALSNRGRKPARRKKHPKLRISDRSKSAR